MYHPSRLASAKPAPRPVTGGVDGIYPQANRCRLAGMTRTTPHYVRSGRSRLASAYTTACAPSAFTAAGVIL